MTTIKKIENSHVAFWLLKDTSWCQHWIYLGLIAAVPTLVVSIIIAWDSRKDRSDLIHNIAVCLWITANIIWMIGEFFYDDGTRHLTRVFFFSGFALLGAYYLHSFFGCVRKWGAM